MRAPFNVVPLVATLLSLGISGCGQRAAVPEQQAAAAQAKIDAFFAAFTDRWVEGDPDLAVSTGYFTGDKQDQLSRQLTPWTREYTLQRLQLAREGKAELAALDLSLATPLQKKAAALMQSDFDLRLAGEPLLDYIFAPLQQMSGANVNLPNTLAVTHPLNTARDAENYVARLALVDDRMQEAIADSALRAEHGVVLPAPIVRVTIDQMQKFIKGPAASNPLVTTLRDKTAVITSLAAEQRAELLKQAEALVADEVYPAYKAAIAEMKRELPLASEDVGLWRFPNGAQVYQYLIERYTTTRLTPDQIHEIGLTEVARIEAEMDALFKQIGMSKGTILQRVQQLTTKTAFPHTDAGRAALTELNRKLLADALERSASLFDVMPRTPVISQPYPQFRWETAAASYTRAPQDGSRPAIYQFPLRDNELMSYDKRSLVYHETVPGHHFQLALVSENKALPRFMQLSLFGSNSAITEGWALYAERLAAESGWYEGDIEGRLGQLDSALFRARRLVVDTGLHAKRWTRQQAIDYGIAPSEVDRYMVWPGQACSYMLGQLKIVELREKARAALGDKFSIKEYHNVVLGAGIVPLTMLEQIVDEYIAARK